MRGRGRPSLNTVKFEGFEFVLPETLEEEFREVSVVLAAVVNACDPAETAGVLLESFLGIVRPPS